MYPYTEYSNFSYSVHKIIYLIYIVNLQDINLSCFML